MRKEIIHINNYLLIVDDSDIKEKSSDWFYSFETNKIYDAKTFHTTVSCKKIIAHLPLNPPFIYGYTNSPILEGVDLLPPLKDEVEKLAMDYRPGAFAFIAGYNKAKEKYKYTEEDLIDVFNFLSFNKKSYSEFKDFIQSLQQPKMPIGFKCEMEVVRDYDNYGSGDIFHNNRKLQLVTTTNSQGLTQWVGEYIY